MTINDKKLVTYAELKQYAVCNATVDHVSNVKADFFPMWLAGDESNIGLYFSGTARMAFAGYEGYEYFGACNFYYDGDITEVYITLRGKMGSNYEIYLIGLPQVYANIKIDITLNKYTCDIFYHDNVADNVIHDITDNYSLSGMVTVFKKQ